MKRTMWGLGHIIMGKIFCLIVLAPFENIREGRLAGEWFMSSKVKSCVFLIAILISVSSGEGLRSEKNDMVSDSTGITSQKSAEEENSDFLTWEHRPGFSLSTPFCQNFGLGFSLKDTSSVGFKFYDLGGHLVKTIEPSFFESGRHMYILNPDDFRRGGYIVVASTNKGKFAKMDWVYK